MEELQQMYVVPRFFKIVGQALELPRLYYTTDVTDLFLNNGANSDEYTSGLLVIPLITLFLLLSWFFVLLFLKLKGDDAGCAAGEAFRTPRMLAMDMGVSVVDAGGRRSRSSNNNNGSSSNVSRKESQIARGAEAYVSPVNIEQFESSTIGSEVDLGEEVFMDEMEEVELTLPLQRERRTQVAFLFFAIVIVTCVPLTLIYSFAPLKESEASSAVYTNEMRDILDQVSSSLLAITDSATVTTSRMRNMTLTVDTVCPGLDEKKKVQGVDVDLTIMMDLIENNYTSIERDVTDKTKRLADILAEILDTLVLTDEGYKTAGTFLWLLPGILFMLSSLTLILLFGVFLSYKRESSTRLQRILSYGILPAFVLFSILCCTACAATGVGTAIFSDVCTYGSDPMSPDNFVDVVFATPNSSETLIKVSDFTTGCIYNDPTQKIRDMEYEVQEIVDYVWRQLSNLDSAGRTVLIDVCGGGNEVEMFLALARDLAKSLTTIRKALNSVRLSLDCDTVYPVYTGFVHDTACTTMANAFARGFVILMVISISSLCIVSLRAAWLYRIGEDLIFDEDEAAENMIVDEHEEYLEYISKYKHEWQEYDGIIESNNKDHVSSKYTSSRVEVEASEIEEVSDTFRINETASIADQSMEYSSDGRQCVGVFKDGNQQPGSLLSPYMHQYSIDDDTDGEFIDLPKRSTYNEI